MSCQRCTELNAVFERHLKRCRACQSELVATCADLEAENRTLRARLDEIDQVRMKEHLVPLARQLGEDPGDGLDTTADAVVRGVERLRSNLRVVLDSDLGAALHDRVVKAALDALQIELKTRGKP